MNCVEMGDKAVRLLEDNKLRRAERLLKQMLAEDPKCLSAHFNLVRVYWRTEQYDLALQHGRRTLKLNPKETNAHLNLSLVFESMGRYKRALYHYGKELALNPFSGETFFNRGRLYFEKHRWLQASKDLSRCYKMGYSFDMADTVYKLAICYNERGDVESYIRLYTEYLQSFPKACWAAANLGGGWMHVKNYRLAAIWFSRAVRLGAKKMEKDLAQAKKMLATERAIKR